MIHIYLAGPLFNTHERRYLEQIAAALEGVGYQVFLPHRDAGLVDSGKTNRGEMFYADLAALEKSDVCVALLTGADHDSGTSAELGYMFAKGKPCFGISDDFRWMNNFIWGICKEGKHIVKTTEELVSLLARSQRV